MPERGQRAGGWQPAALHPDPGTHPWLRRCASLSTVDGFWDCCRVTSAWESECITVSPLAEQSCRHGARARAQQGFTRVAPVGAVLLRGVCDRLGFQCWASVAGRRVQAVLKTTNCSSRREVGAQGPGTGVLKGGGNCRLDLELRKSWILFSAPLQSGQRAVCSAAVVDTVFAGGAFACHQPRACWRCSFLPSFFRSNPPMLSLCLCRGVSGFGGLSGLPRPLYSGFS